MKRFAAAVGGLLIVSVASGCATAEGGSSSANRCGGTAYDSVFQGGSYYDLEDRSRVGGVLRPDVIENGAVPSDVRQRVTNVVGSDATDAVIAAFVSCVETRSEM